VLVDGDAAAIVGFEAGGGKVEVVDGALAAHGVEQRVAGDLLLAFEVGDDGAVGELFNALDLFAQAQGDAASRRW
jgi:formylmethanofuran dehydrogenase subunit C